MTTPGPDCPPGASNPQASGAFGAGPFAVPSVTRPLSPQESARVAQQEQYDTQRAAAGYTVDENGLAQRIGELRAVADAVETSAKHLDGVRGDLGPGDIKGAVHDLANQWRDGLGNMRDRIDDMATAVNATNHSYAGVEAASERTFATEFGVH